MDFGTNIDIGAFAQTAFNAREARKSEKSEILEGTRQKILEGTQQTGSNTTDV